MLSWLWQHKLSTQQPLLSTVSWKLSVGYDFKRCQKRGSGPQCTCALSGSSLLTSAHKSPVCCREARRMDMAILIYMFPTTALFPSPLPLVLRRNTKPFWTLKEATFLTVRNLCSALCYLLELHQIVSTDFLGYICSTEGLGTLWYRWLECLVSKWAHVSTKLRVTFQHIVNIS